ncbi:MAG TPA: recombinase family protein [Acidimicrobiia bacterium]
MRVVGYVRETMDLQKGDGSFAQAERIRRWTNEQGHQLVAVCQDVRTPGHPLGREGLRALIGIISVGQVDAVVVASLQALSPDKLTQEVMIADLRGRGVAVATSNEAEQALLEDPSPDQVRMLVRDALEKAERHRELVGSARTAGSPTILQIAEGSDVIVELIPNEPVLIATEDLLR